MPKLHQITPFIPVTDLDMSIDFYSNCLKFECTFKTENIYAFMRRDDVAIRLIQVNEKTDLHHPERQRSFYVDVHDLDALYAELKPELDKLSEGRVRAPFDQYYNQREFHVIDEDCTLVFFGEPIKAD